MYLCLSFSRGKIHSSLDLSRVWWYPSRKKTKNNCLEVFGAAVENSPD